MGARANQTPTQQSSDVMTRIESAKKSGHYPGLNHTRNQDRQRMQKSGIPYAYEKAPFRGGLARETELLSV
jgi:hypothetical protein